MDIKKYIDKIRNFDILQALLTKKIKSLEKDLEMNKELIVHYEKVIKNYKRMIGIHEEYIKLLKENDTKIEKDISRIKSAKKV